MSAHEIIDIKHLQDLKFIRDHEDDLDLPPIAGGEVVGVLTPDETKVFIELCHMEAELDEVHKELTARSLSNASSAVRRADRPKDVPGILRDFDIIDTDEEGEEVYKQLYQYEYLKVLLWHSVRTRLQTFATIFDIRAGFKIVRVGFKYKRKGQKAS